MKNLFILLFALLALAACNDWLNVSPRGEVKETEMYESEEGFQGVLTGVYIAMASADLYGRAMTIQMPELLARNWDVFSTATVEGNLHEYNFETTAAKSLISNAWHAYYNAIVSLNSLLAAIDARQGLFTHGNYELIKGEAKGLRALLHFDALRFWGPVPGGANTAALTIPYLEEVTRDTSKLISLPYGTVLEKILADLTEAEALLQQDPITRYSRDILNGNRGGVTDEFHYFRQNRFNLFAVKATKARYYQWTGQADLARQHAREVIEAVVSSAGSPVFSLATEETVGGTAGVNPDLLMSVEHVFAVHNPRFSEIAEPFFFIGNCKQEITVINEAYETLYHSDDIRCKANRYWEEFQYPRRQAVFKKFYNPDTKVSADVIPLIRLAEMYFIAMECGTIEEANELLVDFRVARMMDNSIDNSLNDESDVHSRLEKEYRKDFYGEGQMFYYYKRHDVRPLAWPTLAENVVYQVPKPEEQTKYE